MYKKHCYIKSKIIYIESLYRLRTKNVYKRKIGDKMSENALTKDKMLQIEALADSATESLNFDKSPFVDITSLVKKDGFVTIPKLLDLDTTGILHVDESSMTNPIREIIVNTQFNNPDGEEDVIFKKSRFITAHEYAHYKLHMPPNRTFYAHRDSSKRNTHQEQEADFFARSLLMPRKEFSIYYKIAQEIGNNDKIFTIKSLSKLFGVTTKKICERIADLEELEVLNQDG